MTASEKVTALRGEMRTHGVDVLIIPSDDYHQSEYVGDYFKARQFISGFTGSAGTLVVTGTDARLFTDGRYFIQAKRQLSGSGIALMKSGTEGVPSAWDWAIFALPEAGVLAIDGKCAPASTADMLRSKLPAGAKLVTDTDFPGLIWTDRPALPAAPIWALDLKYCGKSHAEKLADVRRAMHDAGCSVHVLASLADIAWLYNLRGSDVKNPCLFLAFCIITEDADTLYANPDAAENVREMLTNDGVTLRPYTEFFADLAALSDRSVLIDRASVSDAIVSLLCKCTLKNQRNPSVLMKAIKNPTELANIRKCHVADGLAVTKMMLELKYGEPPADEIAAEERLLAYRRECAERVGVTFVRESFGTISAFGANAAIVHYKASAATNTKIDRNAPVPMLLIDSGGQYLEGTTDITRTFVLGKLPDVVKLHYTLTAMGMLRLASLCWLHGASGAAMDITCREPLWEHGLDFRHGTGHGIGYLLAVHEGPNRFHFRAGDAVIEAGMITSDEPGIYVEGSHGIRIENVLAAENAEKNEYGQFMRFENLTLCPIDLDGIDKSVMSDADMRRLNDYHARVFEVLSPYLCAGDREKLAYLTRRI